MGDRVQMAGVVAALSVVSDLALRIARPSRDLDASERSSPNQPHLAPEAPDS